MRYAWLVLNLPCVLATLRGFNGTNESEDHSEEQSVEFRSSTTGTYWDGQCSPCPPWLYPQLHCRNGGRPGVGLQYSKPCPYSIALCQAKCITRKPSRPGGGNGGGGGGNGGGNGGQTYADGICTPCPAYLYKHCTAGGKLVSAKPCGWGRVYCEGICSKPLQPTPSPSIPSETVTQMGVKTLYHETSPDAAKKILASAFRPGNSGWCGGAIYFYTSPNIPDSKLGPDSQSGAIIEAQVDLGTNIRLDHKCDGSEQARKKYDSVSFDPGDGLEYLVFSADRILSMSRYS